MKKQRITPSERCVHCGKRITAEDYIDVHRKYTEHVINEHDKPRSVSTDKHTLKSLKSTDE